jgi:hypothetical protein
MESSSRQQHILTPNMPSMWNSLIKSQALERIVSQNQATNSRKRVRFDEDDQSPKRMKVRVVNTRSPSMNGIANEETCSSWYEKGFLRENIRTSKLVATAFALQSSIDCEVKNYSEALVSTYASCIVDSCEDSEVSEHYAQHLALVSNIEHVSIHQESARGLEKIAVPMVGREARRRRNDVIGNVLLAQKTLCQYVSFNERQEIIRKISEEQSRCARMFAKSLGTSDAVSALMEYGSSRINAEHKAENSIATKVDDTLYKPNFGLLDLPNSRNSVLAA